MFNSKFKLKWKLRLYGNQECFSWSKYILHTDWMGSGEQIKGGRGLAMACDIPYLTVHLMCPVFETVIVMPHLLINLVLFGSSSPAVSDTSASQPLMMIKVSEGLWSTFPYIPSEDFHFSSNIPALCILYNRVHARALQWIKNNVISGIQDNSF